jgi:UDP-N-acetylglucosamine--N-acetylmuramyl-(pentapeptide) pyrophosphoryl-undecaprenol N-acetylglucosamine transferase
VYPALAVLQILQAEVSGNEALPAGQSLLSVLWVGGVGGMEVELLKGVGISVETISAGQVHGVGLRALSGLWQLLRGYQQSKRILRRFQPDVLFFTGGYLAVPMAFAGRKVPSLLYVPDIEPGMALKTLACFSDCICLTAEESRAFFSSHANLKVTGYPVRQDFLNWDRSTALQTLHLSADLPVLLVFGGSKGARSINRALHAVLPELLKDMQVIHISGNLDWPEVHAAQEALTGRLAADRSGGSLDPSWARRYHPFPYLHAEMGAALAAADLAVSRAGASTLGEFPSYGLPAILVPYPYAWRYQQVNAQILERHGAARIIQDQDLPDQLLPTIRELMNDRLKRDAMRRAMAALARPQAAKSISALIHSLASRSNDLEPQDGMVPSGSEK